MSKEIDPILADIDAFLARTGMNPTAFGKNAAGDPALVPDLREGRELRRATRQRIIDFMTLKAEAA